MTNQSGIEDLDDLEKARDSLESKIYRDIFEDFEKTLIQDIDTNNKSQCNKGFRLKTTDSKGTWFMSVRVGLETPLLCVYPIRVLPTY